MKQWMMIFLLTVSGSGCVRLHYGNYTHETSFSSRLMAKDTAHQLRTMYPPAQNTWCLRSVPRDIFGVALMRYLRQAGYGINEKGCGVNGSSLRYVMDEPIKNTLLRLTVFIGRQSLSRGYLRVNTTFEPITSWSHKE